LINKVNNKKEVMYMTKEERCLFIVEILKNSQSAVSASELAKQFNISRQVIVQDIALLKAQVFPIISTHKGYILQNVSSIKRIFEVYHQDDEIENELQMIVDLGAQVLDVFVQHETYGKIEASLPIKSRKDISLFIKQIENGSSSPLKNITSNHHFHTVVADDEETLDLIQEALDNAGYLYKK